MGHRADTRRLLIRELSENSRMSVTDLAKRAGCSRNTVMANMALLEKEMGMWYTLEFDRGELGLGQSYLWRVSFGKRPNFDYVAKLMAKEWSVQWVARTEGDFDLVLKIVADSGRSYVDAGRRILTELAKFNPTVNSCGVIEKRLGLVHLQNEILSKLDLSRSGADELDKSILMELNSNSRISSKEMAAKLGREENTIRYRISRIIKSGVIKRFTIATSSPQKGYFAVFFMGRKFTRSYEKRDDEAARFYAGLEATERPTNTFQYLASVAPNDVLFGMAHFDDEASAIQHVVLSQKRIFKADSPVVTFAEIKQILKGNIAFRNINVAQELATSPNPGVSQ